MAAARLQSPCRSKPSQHVRYVVSPTRHAPAPTFVCTSAAMTATPRQHGRHHCDSEPPHPHQRLLLSWPTAHRPLRAKGSITTQVHTPPHHEAPPKHVPARSQPRNSWACLTHARRPLHCLAHLHSFRGMHCWPSCERCPHICIYQQLPKPPPHPRVRCHGQPGRCGVGRTILQRSIDDLRRGRRRLLLCRRVVLPARPKRREESTTHEECKREARACLTTHYRKPPDVPKEGCGGNGVVTCAVACVKACVMACVVACGATGDIACAPATWRRQN